MKRLVRPTLVLLFAGLATVFAFQVQQADPPRSAFSGKVIRVADGDTITVLVDSTQYRIRLEHIDAPESHQDYGTKAKQALADKIFGKEVTVKWTGRDRYKRILGVVHLGGRNVNLELVREGWAWHYLQFSKDQEFAKAEKEAREKKLGLWAGANPIPPWEFRKGKRPELKGDLSKLTVYVTRTGKKYHLDGCRYLAKSKIPISLSAATSRYGPCSVCRPPVLKQEEKEGEVKTPPPLPLEKWDFEYLTKTWGLKPKSVSHIGLKSEYTFVFEFTKDLKPEEVKKLKEDLGHGKVGGSPTLALYAFDKDNVAVEKRSDFFVTGEVTGVKGDAIRMRAVVSSAMGTVRVVLRLK